MTPNKRAGKEVASSSTQSAFDIRRFWDADATAIYEKLSKKSMHREREINLTQPEYLFLHQAKARGWMNFVQQRSLR